VHSQIQKTKKKKIDENVADLLIMQNKAEDDFSAI